MIRFAIWSAVSSKPQAAKDKVSLPNQEKACRGAGEGQGWTEAALYRVPGASRSFYVNLSDAERDIPQLRKMLDDARRDLWDVLVIYTYDRLGDLADMVGLVLRSYGKQLYSVMQPAPIQKPDEFDPLSEAEAIMRNVHHITQQFRINDLRRKYRAGMPKRVSEKGLPPSRIPFGYRKPPGHESDPNAVPEQDPVEAAVVIRIKDLWLGGRSMWQIADEVTKSGALTPRGGKHWTATNVRHILTNPFYGGTVFFGAERKIMDPRTRQTTYIHNSPARMVTARGAHQPLWDGPTQRRVEAEFERRRRNYSGIRTHRLSNLLYCGICGARVYVRYDGHAPNNWRRWGCSADRSHVNRREDELLRAVSDQVVKAFRSTHGLKAPQQPDQSSRLRRELDELQKQQDRLDLAYKKGAMSLARYEKLTVELDTQVADVEKKLARQAQAADLARAQLQVLESFAEIIGDVPEFILRGPEQDVNNRLRTVLERIIISPGRVKLQVRRLT